jgi:transcriptional regulator with XRE-family HTH domain
MGTIFVKKELFPMKIGEKIKKLRKEQKWGQAELAKKLDIHTTHLSKLETDKYMPSLELLLKMAEIFEVTTDYLLYENIDNIGPVNLKDKTLFEKMKLVDDLKDGDKSIIIGVIDSFLTNHQMLSVLNKRMEPSHK